MNDIFEQFMNESHRVFGQKPDNILGLIALWQIQNDVVSKKLSPEDAIEELANTGIVSQRLFHAFQFYKGLNEGKEGLIHEKLDILIRTGQKNDLLNKKLTSDTAYISDQTSSIKNTVNLIDEKMDQVKKRTIRNFRIGLAISLSGITIGVNGLAARYGWFDKSQDQASKAWLNATRLVMDNEKKTQHTHNPIPHTNFLDIWNNGGVVTMRLKNKTVFVYQKSSAPLKAKPPLALAAPSTH